MQLHCIFWTADHFMPSSKILSPFTLLTTKNQKPTRYPNSLKDLVSLFFSFLFYLLSNLIRAFSLMTAQCCFLTRLMSMLYCSAASLFLHCVWLCFSIQGCAFSSILPPQCGCLVNIAYIYFLISEQCLAILIALFFYSTAMPGSAKCGIS